MEEKQRIRDIRVQEKVFDRSREKMNHVRLWYSVLAEMFGRYG